MAVTAPVALMVPAPLRAQSMIRDAEIEETLRIYTTPLFRSAGLDPAAVRILLINDRSLNAFVSGGQNVFIHTGLLMRADHPGQVIGVIAHETGHIMGGHLARLPEAMRNAMITSLIGMIAAGGAAAASAGGRRDPRDTGGMGALGPGIIGAQELGMRQFFAFTRTQENSADQAGVNLLDATGQSARGLLEFMETLQRQEGLSSARQDPYLRTHPLTAERIGFLRNWVANSRNSNKAVPAHLILLHKRMRAKLDGFLDSTMSVLQRYPASDRSIEARYARAVAQYRIPDLPAALGEIDSLIKQAPGDPYFHELRGQMLLENGKVRESIAPWRRAVELKPDAALLKLGLAQALLESGQAAAALPLLQDAQRRDPDNSGGWRMLSVAYGQTGQIGLAHHAAAEQALREGRFRDAIEQAKRAQQQLPQGSPGWLRAQDVENEAVRGFQEMRNR